MKSSVFVGAFWLLMLVGSAFEGYFFPELVNPPSIPIANWILFLFPVAGFSLFSFFVNVSPFFVPPLVEAIDPRFGKNAYEKFLIQLKPILMLAVGSVFFLPQL